MFQKLCNLIRKFENLCMYSEKVSNNQMLNIKREVIQKIARIITRQFVVSAGPTARQRWLLGTQRPTRGGAHPKR